MGPCRDDLTVGQIIAFHHRVMKTDGGDDRLLSEANLHQMVFLTNRIDNVIPRIAFAFFTLVAYPAFREGNCRTARLVADMLLTNNGYTVEEIDDGMTGLAKGIAAFTVELADIEEWLHLYAKKM
jgi:prophage maintenance system killer protein